MMRYPKRIATFSEFEALVRANVESSAYNIADAGCRLRKLSDMLDNKGFEYEITEDSMLLEDVLDLMEKIMEEMSILSECIDVCLDEVAYNCIERLRQEREKERERKKKEDEIQL